MLTARLCTRTPAYGDADEQGDGAEGGPSHATHGLRLPGRLLLRLFLCRARRVEDGDDVGAEHGDQAEEVEEGQQDEQEGELAAEAVDAALVQLDVGRPELG